MSHRHFFWLHVKKSAGQTTRSLLQPYYIKVDRSKKPKNFIQASTIEYNDILNSYRVVLGNYQFRRCLFAKEYLYPEQWDDMFSFAFSREPIDRCVSMFYYLFWKDSGVIKILKRSVKISLQVNKLIYNKSYAFDAFLDLAQEARVSNSIYRPVDNHFTTHTAPMWEDITDFEGNILLKRVFRLENLTDGINQVFEECGIEKRLEKSEKKINKNKRRGLYNPTNNQIKKINEIYHHDFEIYEKAGL